MTFKKLKIRISVAISAMITWIAVGTISFHFIEDWSWIKALYFSVVTITTVGYGDVVPTTDLSRLVAIFYIIFGVAMMLTALASIGQILMGLRKKRIENKK